jgi:hypothetical protein
VSYLAKRMKYKAIDSITSSGMVLLKPYLAWLGTAILSIVLWLVGHLDYFGNPYNWIVVGVLVCTASLGMFMWRASRTRRDFGRFHAVFTLASVGIWLGFAILYAPWNPIVLLVWLVFGLALCGSWNIRGAIKSEKRDDPMRDFFKEHGLDDTKTTILENTKDRIKGIIQVKRGKNTIEDAQKYKAHLASLFKAPKNAVRIQPDRNDVSRGHFTITKRDLLNEIVPFVPDTQRTSANDKFVVGKYETGDPAEFNLHSERLGGIHMLIQGMNGSGKSEGAKVIFARAFNHRKSALIVIDVTKGNQTLNLARNGIHLVISEEALAEALFKRFARTIKDRADKLGSMNKTKWDEESGLTFLYVHIEEASGLIANNPAFIKMMETARSVGVAITASLQRASYVAIDTAARAQFSAVMCFGVQDIADAQFALPDDVLDAGADPSVWRNSKPGYAYLVHPEVDQEKWTVPLRSALMTDQELYDAANAYEKEPIDPITMASLGDIFEANKKSETVVKPTPVVEVEDDDFEEDAVVEIEELKKLESQFEDAFLKFDDAETEMASDEALEVLKERISEFKESGVMQFNAPGLSDVLTVTGRSRAWLHKQLGRLVADGSLTKDDFTYTIVL